MACDERQHAAFALDRQAFGARDDFDRVDASAGKAIDGVEHLERADQIELIDRRHDEDDDPARHWRVHYAAEAKRFASGTLAVAEFDGFLSEADVPPFDRMRVSLPSRGIIK
jgi:hypothetical protein